MVVCTVCGVAGGLTGERAVAGAEEQAACKHEGQKSRGPLKVRPQSKNGRPQNSQEGEEKHADCRRDSIVSVK